MNIQKMQIFRLT